MSSDSESISSGITLPQWMRPKQDRTDIDSIAFSPPSHDDSFFYIRYPKKPENITKNDVNQIGDMLQLKTQQVDFSKHTEPCKRFLKSTDSVNSVEGVKNPPKSFGTDDGFKGAGAACGSSIVKVAQQMVSGRSLTNRGFKVAQFENEEPDSDEIPTKTIEDQQSQTSKLIQAQQFLDDKDAEMTQSSRLMIRRGSKSLPSSPLGSPKSMRKYQPNPYFTGSFALSGAKNNSPSEGRGWFLSSLLGIHRENPSLVSSAVNNIQEEEQENKYSMTPETTESPKDYTTQKILRAKPSELREMNFWSPTSM